MATMQPVFMDESGDLGFGCGTKFFVLAFIAPAKGKQLNKVIKNFNAHLIRNGWNPDIEVKATNLWHSPKHKEIDGAYIHKNDPATPMAVVLKAIAAVEGYIEYVAVKLDTVSPGLQKAHCNVLYNYFSWQLVRGALCHFEEVHVYADRRSRDLPNLLKFDGYIESKAGIARAEKGKNPLSLSILHYSWNSPNDFAGPERARVEYGVRGLEAADFVCWAIKRKFENGDDQWFKIIEKKIQWKQHLYGSF
jgi:Protein of unknown function (DUF3800)